jgi:hypothetical protein
MIWTLPFVLYGIFRYLYLAYRRDEGGAPEALLLQDAPLLVNVLLWLATISLILYCDLAADWGNGLFLFGCAVGSRSGP